MKIAILDSAMCETDDSKTLGEFLRVEKFFWKKNGPKMEKIPYFDSLVSRKGLFLTGFIPRIIKACETRKIPLEVTGTIEKLPFDGSLNYPKLTLYDDQKELVSAGLKAQRGIIVSPTGTGKTVICYALIYPCLPCKALVIVPSIEILHQTAQEFREKFGLKTSVCGDGKVDLSGDVVVGLINTIANILCFGPDFATWIKYPPPRRSLRSDFEVTEAVGFDQVQVFGGVHFLGCVVYGSGVLTVDC